MTNEHPITNETPTPMALDCPNCGKPHVDEGEWATRPHKTHQCQFCAHEWRPFKYATVGIAAAPGSVPIDAREWLQSKGIPNLRLVFYKKSLAELLESYSSHVNAAAMEKLDIARQSLDKFRKMAFLPAETSDAEIVEHYMHVFDSYYNAAKPLESRISELERERDEARRIVDIFCESHLDTTIGSANVSDPCPLCVIAERAESQLSSLREALRKIAAWEFDIMGDCVADAKRLAERVLAPPIDHLG